MGYRNVLLAILLAGFVSACTGVQPGSDFRSVVPDNVDRPWIGPSYWSNPLQDWKTANGEIQNTRSGGDRNVQLLTHQLSEEPGDFSMSVNTRLLESDSDGWTGFRVGIRGWRNDYRHSLIFGTGLAAGIDATGRLFIGGVDSLTAPVIAFNDTVNLVIKGTHQQSGNYRLTLEASTAAGGITRLVKDEVSANLLHGNVGVVCSSMDPFPLHQMADGDGFISRDSIVTREPPTARRGQRRCSFDEWDLSGSKVEVNNKQEYGPILFSMYSLSRNVVKLTAQMVPLASNQSRSVALELKRNDRWSKVAEAGIDPLARTASFRLEHFDATDDTDYRIVYEDAGITPGKTTFTYEGTIRKEPVDKDALTIGGLSCNLDLAFPNPEILSGLNHFDPDILAFLGDQLYERNGGFGNEPHPPVDMATLDYLRKWFLFGWSFRDVMRDRPTINITDDHDVYHGNIWGDGGKATPEGLRGAAAQDQGGYKMPAEWVNMVQQTQTSHMPDPYDPTPIEQGIGVYYTGFVYGGVSFGVIEDRKWKSPPKQLLPEAEIWNGWPQNRNFDPAVDSDVSGANLLGQRQMKFLETWVHDWSDDAEMKVLFSASIFTNMATLPAGSMSDEVVPGLKVFEKGEYAPDDEPVADFDSNGWPKSGRDQVVDHLRRGFVLHIAGDQHLGSTLQYGIDSFGDAGYAICVPAIANVWPRRWMPTQPGLNHIEGLPRYTGDFVDRFGNLMTVFAAGNPYRTGLFPEVIFDRAPGYGIIQVNKKTRNYTLENWPMWVDPATPDARPFAGWPIQISQSQNYGREKTAWLPELFFGPVHRPAIQIINEATKEVEYSIRVNADRFHPFVFEPGTYSVILTEVDGQPLKTITGLSSQPLARDSGTLRVDW